MIADADQIQSTQLNRQTTMTSSSSLFSMDYTSSIGICSWVQEKAEAQHSDNQHVLYQTYSTNMTGLSVMLEFNILRTDIIRMK